MFKIYLNILMIKNHLNWFFLLVLLFLDINDII